MRTSDPARPTTRSLLRDAEFRALFASYGLSVLGDQVARVAVALLVYQRSHSALAAAAVFACSFLPVLLGGPVLSALADRFPRRAVMISCDLLRAVLVFALVVPDLPLPVVFALLLVVGVLEPPFDSARVALLADVLTGESYVVGNTLMHVVVQSGQVAGYLAGGLLVTASGVGGALSVDAGTFLASALIVLLAMRPRPAAQDESGRGTLLADTMAGLRYVAAEPDLRRLLGLAVLGTTVVIVPEGLAVPVAASLHSGSVTAGVLTAALPAGFVLGGWLLIRFAPRDRERLLRPLVVVSCLPLLLAPVVDNAGLMCALWVVAGVFSCLQVIANSAYVAAVPPAMRARAFGVAGTVLTAAQGVLVLAAGAVAAIAGPRMTVALTAALVLVLVAVSAAVDRPAGAKLGPAAGGSAASQASKTQDGHG